MTPSTSSTAGRPFSHVARRFPLYQLTHSRSSPFRLLLIIRTGLQKCRENLDRAICALRFDQIPNASNVKRAQRSLVGKTPGFDSQIFRLRASSNTAAGRRRKTHQTRRQTHCLVLSVENQTRRQTHCLVILEETGNVILFHLAR